MPVTKELWTETEKQTINVSQKSFDQTRNKNYMCIFYGVVSWRTEQLCKNRYKGCDAGDNTEVDDTGTDLIQAANYSS